MTIIGILKHIIYRAFISFMPAIQGASYEGSVPITYNVPWYYECC